MSLGKQVIGQLRLLANESPEAAGAVRQDDGLLVLTTGGDNGQLTLVFADYDRYSVTLRRLELGTGARAISDTQAALSACAAEVARQLSFLEEPLAVWELDSREGLAQLRSSPPLREAADVTYWEVTLQVGTDIGASVARYHWAPGMAEREVIDYPATFALVGRMGDALAAALT